MGFLPGEARRGGEWRKSGAPAPALPETQEAALSHSAGGGRSGPVVESTSTSTPLGHSPLEPRNFNFWEAHGQPVASPGPGPRRSPRNRPPRPRRRPRRPNQPDAKPLQKAGRLDVAAAVSAATFSPPSLRTPPPAAAFCFKWTQQDQTTDSDFDYEHISIVTHEIGSQVQ